MDKSYLLGEHLEKCQFKYSREYVIMNEEIKIFIYLYDDFSNKWYVEEFNKIK